MASKEHATQKLIIMRNDLPQKNSIFRNIPIYVLGFIVVGIFMGGIYSLPAMRITKSTDPWLTILLSISLTITVTTIGVIFYTSYLHVIYAILIANILLVIRRCFGKLDHNAERFGLIHGMCLIGSFWYVILLKK